MDSVLVPAIQVEVATVLAEHEFPVVTTTQDRGRLRACLADFAFGRGPAAALSSAAVADRRLSLGLLVDVVAVLVRHGLPAPASSWDLSRLMESLGGFLHPTQGRAS